MSFSNLQRGDQTKCLFCCFYCCLIKLNHLYTDLFKVYVFLLFSPIRSTVCAGTTGFKKDAVISYLIDVSHEKQVIIAIAVGWREFISCVIKSSTSTIKSFTFVFFHSCLSLLSLSCSRINILLCLCAAFTAFSACYISRNFHFASWYLILKPFICRHRRQRASFIAAVFTPAVSLFKIGLIDERSSVTSAQEWH